MVFAAGLIGAACCVLGGSVAGASQAGASHADAVPVTISTNFPVVTQFPAWLAAQENLYPPSVNVTVQALSSTTQLPSLLAGGSQFAQTGGSFAELGQAAGVQIAYLAEYVPKTDVQVIAQPGINTMADLRGKKLGISAPGQASELWMNWAVNQAKLTTNDVTLISLGSLGGLDGAFLGGSIDAFVDAQPNTNAELSAVPGSKVIFNFWTSGMNFPQGLLVGYMPWVKAHPAATVAVLTGINRALALIRSSPALVEPLLAQFTNTTNQSDLNVAWNSLLQDMQTTLKPYPLASAQFVHTLLVENGFDVHAVPPKAVIASPVYVNAAVKAK
jgi:ABC-type nitrate/sulfonate/bicarbonate transport system substrate-binding protein